jgi:hypothetical protein
VFTGGEAASCYGLDLVCEGLRRRGHVIGGEPAKPSGITLCSLYWPDQLYDLVRWLKRTGYKRFGRPMVVGGNTATANPAAVLPWVERVFLGDGEDWDGQLDGPHMVAREAPAPAVISRAAAVHPLPIVAHKKTDVSVVEISRGCKQRCFFCQYAWLKPYREADLTDVAIAIRKRTTKVLRVFAADRAQHSSMAAVTALIEQAHALDLSSDASLRHIIKRPGILAHLKRLRLGIEGMSARLRRMVGKPATDDEIVEVMREAGERGIRHMHWYLIFGLPGETDDDARQFAELLARVGEVLAGRGLTMFVVWNAFQPSPLTPMQWCAAAYQYPRERLELVRRAWVPGLTMAYRGGNHSDGLLLARMIASRAGEGAAELVYNLALKRQMAKQATAWVRREFERVMGFDAVGALDQAQPLPWDRYVQYDRAKLERIYRSIADGTTVTPSRG